MLRHLVPYLLKEDHTVDVYCRGGVPKPSDEQTGQHQDKLNQIFTKGIESKSISTLSFGLSSAINASRRKPDIALVMNVANGYWLPLLRSKRIPTIVNVDGIEWDRDKWGPIAKTVFRTGATMTARFADQLIVDSENIGNRWKDDFGRESVFIPYGGTQETAEEITPKYDPGTYVLYVARFVPENSILEFAQAAEEISQTHQVVIVGSSGYAGEIEERIEKLSERNSKIDWLGHINDDAQLHSLWRNSGAYYHGHSVGGTNPALVQAMACGAAVVARDTIYNREVLGDAGIYAEHDPTDISAKVANVLADRRLRDRMKVRSKLRQQEHYTWDAVCRKYESAMEETILHNSSPTQVTSL